MDKIIVEGMEFFGYHGVLPEEQQLGQRFIVDLEMKKDLQPAGRSDDLQLTVNYAQVYQRVKQIVETEKYQLIEALAEKIAQTILAEFSVQKIKVKVNKPQAPIAGIFRSVAVKISREKS